MRREAVTPSLWPRVSHGTGHREHRAGVSTPPLEATKPGMAGPKGTQGCGDKGP